MANTVRYNVVVSLVVDSKGIPQGNKEVETELRRSEKQFQDYAKRRQSHQEKMFDDEVRNEVLKNQKIANERSKFHQNEYQKQKAVFDKQQQLAYKSNLLNTDPFQKTSTSLTKASKELEKFTRQYEVFNNKLIKNDPFQKIQNLNFSQTIKELDNFHQKQQKIFASKLNQLDPFQNAKNQSANRTGQMLNFERQILDKDPFQTAKTLSLKNTIKEIDKFDKSTKEIDKFDNALKRNKHEMSMWSNAFKGAFVGAVAGLTFSLLISGIFNVARGFVDLSKNAVLAGGKLEQTTNALSVFTGTTSSAQRELRELDQIALNSPGLRLDGAREGFKNLRALGFEANLAKGFVKELGEEKLLSGATNESLDRVIFNFAQIASGGQKVSQELREILTQMPSMKRAFFDAFGTLDPKKMQKFFDDGDKGFNMLLASMQKNKPLQQGFNDAWDKFLDTFQMIGEELSKPMLEPLTETIKDMTLYLRENMSVWREWGEYIGDVIEGFNVQRKLNQEGKFAELGNPFLLKTADGRDIPKMYEGFAGQMTDTQKQRLANSGASQSWWYKNFGDSSSGGFRDAQGNLIDFNDPKWKQILQPQSVDQQNQDRGYFADLRKLGASSRLQRGINRKLAEKPEILRPDFTIDFDLLNGTQEELNAIALAKEEKAQVMREKLRQKELSQTKTIFDEKIQISKNYYRELEAISDARLSLTPEGDIQKIKENFAIRKNALREEVSLQEQYFNRLIELNEGDNEKTFEIQAEKNTKIRDLNSELRINEINAQRDVQRIERQILEERRSQLLAFKELNLRETNQKNEFQVRIIERNLNAEKISTANGYNELRRLSEQNFTDNVRMLNDQLNLKLKNERLTDQERINLQKETNLEIQKLAFDNSERLIDIERKQYEAEINLFEQKQRRKQEIASEMFQLNSEIVSYYQNSVLLGNKPGMPGVSFYNDTLEALSQERANENKLQDYLKQFRNTLQSGIDKGFDVANEDRIKNVKEIIQKNTGVEIGFGSNRLTDMVQVLDIYIQDSKLLQDKSFKFSNLIADINKGLIKSFEMMDEAYKTMEKSDFTSQSLETYQIDSLAIKQKQTLDDFDRTLRDAYAYQDEVLKNKESKASERADARNKVTALYIQRGKILIQQAQEMEALKAKLPSQLKAELERYESADKFTIGNAKQESETAYYSNRINNQKAIIDLEFQLAKVGEDSAERYRLAWLKATYEVEDAQIRAIERQISAQIKLANRLTISLEEIRANVLEHLASQKSLTDGISDGINKTFDNLSKRMDDQIDKMFKWAGDFAPLFTEPFKVLAKQPLVDMTTKLLDYFIPGAGEKLEKAKNPVLGELKVHTKLLESIAGQGNNLHENIHSMKGLTQILTGGFGNGSGGGRFGAGFGGGFGNPNVFSFGGNRLFGGLGGIGTRTGDINANGEFVVRGGDKGRDDFWSNLKQIFKKDTWLGKGGIFGKGGVFGEKGFGFNTGTIGVLGSVASLIGGAIGGVAGSALQGAGTGSSIGMMFGGPIGGAIGAGIGAIVGLFSGFGRKKKEKRLASQTLAKALSEIDKLIADVKYDKIDGDTALSQAKGIRNEYMQAVSQIKSKSVRRKAEADVSQIDSKISQLEIAIGEQRSRKQRLELYAPTFKDGGNLGYDGGTLSNFAIKSFKNNPLGYQYGSGNGREDDRLGYFSKARSLARYSPNEYIFDARTTRKIGLRDLEMIRHTEGLYFQKLKEMALRHTPRRMNGGAIQITDDNSFSTKNSNQSNQPITVELTVVNQLGFEEFAKVMAQAVNSTNGSVEQVNAIANQMNLLGSNNALLNAILAKIKK